MGAWAQAGSSCLFSPWPAAHQVEFHGLAAVHGDLFLNGNASLQRLEVVCPPDLNAERLSPSITLNRVSTLGIPRLRPTFSRALVLLWMEKRQALRHFGRGPMPLLNLGLNCRLKEGSVPLLDLQLRTAVRPSEAKVQPLSGPRDALPNGRQIHALLLVYKFSVSEGGRFTPRFPLLNQRLYDNEYEGQFYMIFDSNKVPGCQMLLYTTVPKTNAYCIARIPSAMCLYAVLPVYYWRRMLPQYSIPRYCFLLSFKECCPPVPCSSCFLCVPLQMLLSQEDCYPKSVKLGKGDYILRLQVRHDNTSYLDKLKKMPLLLDRALDDKVRRAPAGTSLAQCNRKHLFQSFQFRASRPRLPIPIIGSVSLSHSSSFHYNLMMSSCILLAVLLPAGQCEAQSLFFRRWCTHWQWPLVQIRSPLPRVSPG